MVIFLKIAATYTFSVPSTSGRAKGQNMKPVHRQIDLTLLIFGFGSCRASYTVDFGISGDAEIGDLEGQWHLNKQCNFCSQCLIVAQDFGLWPPNLFNLRHSQDTVNRKAPEAITSIICKFCFVLSQAKQTNKCRSHSSTCCCS